VPPTGFKINVNNILPGVSKGVEGRFLFTLFVQTLEVNPEFIWLVSFNDFFMPLLKEKDTSWYHRLPIHQGKGQFCLEEYHGGLDEMLAESEHFLSWSLKETTR
jgi:hypothetical protein